MAKMDMKGRNIVQVLGWGEDADRAFIKKLLGSYVRLDVRHRVIERLWTVIALLIGRVPLSDHQRNIVTL